jgi:predicted AAA+ superfamily ATPase
MAVSNRDRVGRAFETLATGLGPYLQRRLGKSAPGNDPAAQLRAMVETWDSVFRAELTRADRNIVFELRDSRNRWAHNEAFTTDDAYRVLDSVERLLTAVDAREAREVGQSKEELMRAKFEAQARKATPTNEAIVSAPAAGLKPWREVIQPHDDVARGKFALAEFAADLYQVALGDGATTADEYGDPTAFFNRTFLTGGLRDLLRQAVERLTGPGGVPIVDLQTSFGGGKTHSMIALYHLFSGTPLDDLSQEVQDLVREVGVDKLPDVQRAVLVGTELAPGVPSIKNDGTEVGTLWGELAWQLGGKDAFDVVAEADRTRSNPGGALRDLLQLCSPCLILIDEWVAYARGLYADDGLRGGTFDTHFSFAQALTEAARSVESALLVVSIPASESADGGSIGSDIEVGGAGGREALRRLRAVVARMESSWRPATADESFEIVRRRLFQPIDASRLAYRDATARVFGDLYQRQASEFPNECREPAYVEKMKRAYPIHPELFARLYEDWSTLERFQRTRGVLRLMATVVHSLWASGDQAPLILPASVQLNHAEVVSELTRNLEDAWKPIIDADIDGDRSLPRALDDEFKNLGRYLAVRRVARTVFLGSAPLVGTPNQGLDAARVRLGCAMPGETVAVYGDALNRLADRGTYFYAGGGRYWYGTQPGVGRLVRDRSERILAGDRHEIRDAVFSLVDEDRRAGTGAFSAVHVMPNGPEDVNDTPDARLVVLGPDTAHLGRSEESAALQLAKAILERKASGPRDYRNMVVFLAADQRKVADLEQAVADWLAWRGVVGDATTLNLDEHQKAQANDRVDDARRTVDARLRDAYVWLLAPRQPEPNADVVWESTKVESEDRLVARTSAKLIEVGALFVAYPSVFLRMALNGALSPLWESGTTTVDAVWAAYSRYLYLHRLANSGVLRAAVAAAPASTAWESEGFAVAETASDGQLLGLHIGEHVASVRDDSLLVQPGVALSHIQAERPAEEAGDDAEPTEPGRQLPTRFRRWIEVKEPERFARDAGKIAQEVVSHLTSLVDAEVKITIEVDATSKDGFSDEVVRNVSENADALGFDKTSGFS